jgi:hypothetical protein
MDAELLQVGAGIGDVHGLECFKENRALEPFEGVVHEMFIEEDRVSMAVSVFSTTIASNAEFSFP